MTSFKKQLTTLRQAFPPPVSDPVHDGYVVFSILRALDQIDALKTQRPILGLPSEPDYEAAQDALLEEQGKVTEEVIPHLVRCLEGMVISGHPRSQMNVYAHPSIASLIGVILPAVFSPNLCSDEAGGGIHEAEVRVSAMTASLIGYDPHKAGGLFTFGGTAALLYGVKIGLEKAVPDTFRQGLKEDVALLVSEQGHSSCLNVAAWLGMGQDHVIKVPSHGDNSMDVDLLEWQLHELLQSGRKVAAIIATLGTTDAFGIDDIEAICKVRDRLCEEYQLPYKIHVHADAVIGWAWSVFSDYDFQKNPLSFSGRTVRALAAANSRIRSVNLADSVGIDFHKTGYAPYISSLVLLADRDEFRFVARDRESMPYLFHSGEYHPGMYTLETSRSGTGPMAALASLLLLGKQGLRTLIGHSVEMQELLREQIAARPELTVLNDENMGPVTLLRAYPPGVDTFKVKKREMEDSQYREETLFHNELNRRIFDRVHRDALSGNGVAIGLTSNYRTTRYGEPIVALKSYVLSPFADESRMMVLLNQILAAREAVQAEMLSE